MQQERQEAVEESRIIPVEATDQNTQTMPEPNAEPVPQASKPEPVNGPDENLGASADTDTGEDFGKLLAASQTKNVKLEEGDEVTGVIVNISDAYIFISLGDKLDAIAEVHDYANPEGELSLKVGDQLTGFVVKKTDSETIIAPSLTRTSASKAMLRDANERKIPVNGKVESIIKGGYNVDVLGERAFCPVSQIDIKPVVDNTEYLGRTFDFEVIEYSENGRNIVVSRRVLLERGREKLRNETMANIHVNAEVKGRVTRLTNFGAFVDIGGVEGLLHISEMAWNRVESPSDILNIGQEIDCQVIRLKNDKISLSLKSMQKNPLDSAMDDFEVGQIVECRIMKNETFGSFAEIVPGVQGLIPISELKRGRRISKPSEVVQVGDVVQAKIVRLNPETKKISLSLKALEPDPWDIVHELIQVNEVIDGIIEGITEFGTFVRIRDGLTGLIPKSKMKRANLNYNDTNLNETVRIRVTEIDSAKQRLSLEPEEMPAFEPRDDRFDRGDRPERSDREPRRGREDRDEWRKYAKQKWDTPEDNPFSKL